MSLVVSSKNIMDATMKRMYGINPLSLEKIVSVIGITTISAPIVGIITLLLERVMLDCERFTFDDALEYGNLINEFCNDVISGAMFFPYNVVTYYIPIASSYVICNIADGIKYFIREHRTNNLITYETNFVESNSVESNFIESNSDEVSIEEIENNNEVNEVNDDDHDFCYH